MARLSFALWALKARFNSKHHSCPYCGSILNQRLQTKKFLIEARKCHYCSLIFRWPTDDQTKATQFYEEEYDGGIVTDLPSPQEIERLRATAFRNSIYDKSGYIKLIKNTLPPPARILDFGSSWGYLGVQLCEEGYEAEGFELSPFRARFGREHLNIPIHHTWDQLDSMKFDIIFSAHTLEHTYDLHSTLMRLAQTMKTGGLLILVVPNCGGSNARRLGINWGPFLGETHTIAFTADWFRQNLYRHRLDLVELYSLDLGEKDITCDGDELVCISRYFA